MLKPLLLSLQFLTRIPVPALREVTPRDMGRSLLFYPLIGALIGGVLFGLEHLLPAAAPMLAAVLLIAVWVALTGALHLDGLADMADGWIGGHGDRERTLAIMKDPACGPMGVTALLLLLLLKAAALAQLVGEASLLLFAAPLLARSAVLLLFLTTPYVRKGGLGEVLAQEVPHPAGWLVVMLTMAGVLLLPTLGVGVLAMLAMVFVLFRQALMARLGGTTGDTAGALVELCEVTVLIYSALL